MRYKIEFEIAVRDGDEEGLKVFKQQLQHLVDHNIPAMSGWAKIDNPHIIPIEPVTQSNGADNLDELNDWLVDYLDELNDWRVDYDDMDEIHDKE